MTRRTVRIFQKGRVSLDSSPFEFEGGFHQILQDRKRMKAPRLSQKWGYRRSGRLDVLMKGRLDADSSLTEFEGGVPLDHAGQQNVKTPR